MHFLALTGFALGMSISAANASDHIPQSVVDTAATFFPDAQADQIEPSPLPGLFQLTAGPRIVYISADGRYLVNGDILDIEKGVNTTEESRKQARLRAIEGLGEDSMIVFEPEETKASISVFTDISCPYCAKLHSEVPDLNKRGVKVRYLAFPRAGVPSEVATAMANVWCSDDTRQAMTDAKQGFPVEEKSCTDPVREHYNMGVAVGVSGTPTIVLEDGSILGGYVPYQRLAKAAIRAHGN